MIWEAPGAASSALPSRASPGRTAGETFSPRHRGPRPASPAPRGPRRRPSRTYPRRGTPGRTMRWKRTCRGSSRGPGGRSQPAPGGSAGSRGGSTGTPGSLGTTTGMMRTMADGTRTTIQRLPTDTAIGEGLGRRWIGEGEKDPTQVPKAVEKADEKEMLVSCRRERPSGTRSHGARPGQRVDQTVKADGMGSEDQKWKMTTAETGAVVTGNPAVALGIDSSRRQTNLVELGEVGDREGTSLAQDGSSLSPRRCGDYWAPIYVILLVL
mmetsp:Transcript_69105/g.158649  ORF Transcript_69105/g.158649 Transcript_69105/m.158649 type:complete len:268 (+) Transcript_69105:519-1322(+)